MRLLFKPSYFLFLRVFLFLRFLAALEGLRFCVDGFLTDDIGTTLGRRGGVSITLFVFEVFEVVPLRV
jgi:hypothetical protein